jgi:hypothetical protein
VDLAQQVDELGDVVALRGHDRLAIWLWQAPDL